MAKDKAKNEVKGYTEAIDIKNKAKLDDKGNYGTQTRADMKTAIAKEYPNNKIVITNTGAIVIK